MSIDLTLERIAALMSHLPDYTRPTIHIAGTNGKGSVSALTASILQASGLTVGRFNSPHLLDPHDCIAINDQVISPEVFAGAQAEVRRVDQELLHGTNVSSFEILTLTAFVIFQRENVDVAVVECGMGGKRDATNVLPDRVILVSALTSVDLDHQAFLGNTVEEIASDKVGIWRRGKAFVLGPQKHEGVVNTVRSVVDEADLVFASAARVLADNEGPIESHYHRSSDGGRFKPTLQRVHVQISSLPPISADLPLQGEHQLENLGIATSVVSSLLTRPSCEVPTIDWKQRLTPESISLGISRTRWPGRLSFHTYHTASGKNISVLVDGAHNAASASTLADYIAQLTDGPPSLSSITFILALSHSPPKTPLQTLSPIFAHPSIKSIPRVRVAPLAFSPPENMPWVKVVPPSTLRETLKEVAPYAELCSPLPDDDANSVGQAGLRTAIEWAAEGPDGLVVVAGSLYLVADFYRLLGGMSSV